MTPRKDRGLGGTGGRFAEQITEESGVDLPAPLSQRDRQSLEDLVEFAETGAVLAVNPHVRWRGMKGMRDVVAHEYGAIDYNIVWNSLANDLPTEVAEVQRILDT